MLEALLEEASLIADSRNGEVLQCVLERLKNPPAITIYIDKLRFNGYGLRFKGYGLKPIYHYERPVKHSPKGCPACEAGLVKHIDCIPCFYKVEFEDAQNSLAIIVAWAKAQEGGQGHTDEYYGAKKELELKLINCRSVMERNKCNCGGKEYQRLREAWPRAQVVGVQNTSRCD